MPRRPTGTETLKNRYLTARAHGYNARSEKTPSEMIAELRRAGVDVDAAINDQGAPRPDARVSLEPRDERIEKLLHTRQPNIHP